MPAFHCLAAEGRDRDLLSSEVDYLSHIVISLSSHIKLNGDLNRDRTQKVIQNLLQRMFL